ncbi:serine/threonine-protein kinase [Nocardia carnea]|uniref:serine/threonine-protein kinase n=1 Tax=Nocardia carnea TaxID=37328 RepID=UPI00245815A1|nr:serine/threonine-protein kinase [Nocardia carnea]
MGQPATPRADTLGRSHGDQLAETLRLFTAAWQDSPPPPDLSRYLPGSAALRRVALIELIKIDLVHRRRYTGQSKRLADYVAEFPELGDRPLPPDLIYEEYHQRRRAGQPVDPGEYTAEFPGQAAELSELLATGEYRSTLFGNRADEKPATVDDIDAGTRIDDFDLLTLLGRGAFAKVFLARQRTMQRLVAVKISADSGTEPQTLAQLDHDYIVRVFDRHILPEPRLRLLYMQYVPGGTLLTVLDKVRDTRPTERTGALLLESIDEVLDDKGEIRPAESAARTTISALTWPETVAWLGTRLARALDHADRAGVLHRDVKPANVLLTADAVPKLADFNISFGANVAGSSPVAYFGGSLAYMSPEQLAVIHPGLPGTAADLDTRSDLYALAVVLWELLTGRRPFDDTATATGPATGRPEVTADAAAKPDTRPPISATRDDTAAGPPHTPAASVTTEPPQPAPGDRTTLEAMLSLRRRGARALPYRDLPPDCPDALRRTLVRALDPDPDRRWAHGADMARQLRICLDPRARDLVDPPRSSLRRRARALLHPIMFLSIAVPNALAIWYSYYHNRVLIIDGLDTGAHEIFQRVAPITYGLAFLAGFVVTTVLTAHLGSVLRGLRRGGSGRDGRGYETATLARARRDTLLLSSRTVLACFLLWAITGIAVPVTVQASGSTLGAAASAHFFGTQIICGAMAMAYPYFLVGSYAVRSLYPAFLPLGGAFGSDVEQLRALDRRSTYFLLLAAAVPLLGAAGATFLPAADVVEVLPALRVLLLGSALAFAVVYLLFRTLESDIAALERVVAHGIAPHAVDSASTV